jgi:hypothetical protein
LRAVFLGGAPSGIFTGTVEGVKGAFNVQILSHFLIPYLLLSLPDPVLGNDAQICNIARPGEVNRNIDFDDFRSLKAVEAGTFSILRDAMKFVFIMDLFTHVSAYNGIWLTYLQYVQNRNSMYGFPAPTLPTCIPGQLYRPA